jgi:hypothetical protein
VRAFLRDLIDEHHGDHAGRYLAKDMQRHGGTVGRIRAARTSPGYSRALWPPGQRAPSIECASRSWCQALDGRVSIQLTISRRSAKSHWPSCLMN